MIAVIPAFMLPGDFDSLTLAWSFELASTESLFLSSTVFERLRRIRVLQDSRLALGLGQVHLGLAHQQLGRACARKQRIYMLQSLYHVYVLRGLRRCQDRLRLLVRLLPLRTQHLNFL
jgi:hypothetical protein